MSKLDEIVLAINPRLSEFPDQLVEAKQAIQQELLKARLEEQIKTERFWANFLEDSSMDAMTPSERLNRHADSLQAQLSNPEQPKGGVDE